MGAASQRGRAARKPPASPTAAEKAAAEKAAAEKAAAEQAPAEQAPTEQATAEQAPAEQAPAEQAPAEQAGRPQRRRHPVKRDVEHDRVRFTPESEELPAFEEAQFEQLKLVGAVEGDWTDGVAVDD